jgi:dTDP-4-dehydrorhamnose 3,5-epimerase
MKLIRTSISDVVIIEPRVFHDDRGFFFESWNAIEFANQIGIGIQFVQDNHSRSRGGVLRGLHYQIKRSQGKLVRVLRGRVLDVAVDLRKSSPSFGQWVATELSDRDHRHVWIPAGFAHGFLVLSDSADVFYKTTDYYAPECERCIVWNDPTIGIKWPSTCEPVLSEKDQSGVLLRDAELFP